MVRLLVMFSICEVVAEVVVLAKSRRYFVEVGWVERRRRAETENRDRSAYGSRERRWKRHKP